MKEFKNLTELQILNYACDRLLELYLAEKERYYKHKSELGELKYLKREAQYNEVRNEIIRLEKLQNNK